MRRLALSLLLALAPTVALGAGLSVGLDEAIRVALPVPAADVIVGNPAIADVSVADRFHLVITGKSYGVTNLVVADAAGRTVLDRRIVVSAPDDGQVSVFHGPDVVTFACAPRCQKLPSASGGGAPSP